MRPLKKPAKTAPKLPRKKRGRPADLHKWIPRREASNILNVSTTTLMRWRGERFRMKTTSAVDGRIRWWCLQEDVERVRLDRMGPHRWELERYVLDSIQKGLTPTAIIQGRTHLTLADIERIRDQDARLSGACVLEPPMVKELRALLDVELMTGAALIAHVRALVERVELLARIRTKRSEPPPAPASSLNS